MDIVSFDRRMQVLFNLEAAMPTRRPFGSNTASSRCFLSSGSVLGDGVLGCAVMLRRGGEGAEPDCVQF
jgi:hypothetical protein